LKYFERRIYENQKEFALDSIPRTFNRYYIGDNMLRRGQSIIDNILNKPWEGSPSKKPKKEETISQKL
jgi:hypothetical protein